MRLDNFSRALGSWFATSFGVKYDASSSLAALTISKDPQLQFTYGKELDLKSKTSGFKSHKLMGLVFFHITSM